MQEWVGGAFAADGCAGAVAGVDGHVIGQGHEDLHECVLHVAWVGGGEIHAADGACKEGVADDGLFGIIVDVAHAAGAVAGGVQDAPLGAVQFEGFAAFEEVIRLAGGHVSPDEG